MKDTGLILGKFAPFHRGHQFLIETALAEVRRLIVVVYPATRTTDIPLPVRAGWIRSIHPGVEVIEAEGGPEDTGYTEAVMRAQERFLAGLLEGRTIDAFYSSEPYGAHVSAALGCEDRRVDQARSRFPVSGTMLRNDPESRRLWLHPAVRADMVGRIVLLGGPSTGKTSLAKALAERLGEPWCPEYGREYWFRHQVDHRLSMAGLETIAREQAASESRLALEARAWLPVDTCPLTTWAYAIRYFGAASPAIEEELDRYLAFPRRYRLCAADFPFEDTPDRSGPGSREELQALTVGELDRRGVPWETCSGPLADRVESIARALAR